MNIINPEGHILVIGAAGVDVKGRPHGELHPNTLLVGDVRFNMGGVARNIAENLARLEVPTILLTAVGDDPAGEMVVTACSEAGIDMQHVLRVPGENTGAYMAFMSPDNDEAVSLSDYALVGTMPPDYLTGNKDLFESAAMVVIDANLPPDALVAIFDLARMYRIPVCADPTTPDLAVKLIEHLPHLYMVAPNRAETKTLCGLSVPAQNVDTAISAAHHLVGLGVKIAIVTLGAEGLAYADISGGGHIPAIRTNVVDSIGAGDALTAGIIFGLINGVPLDEAMRLGVSAATLTLRSSESVVPDLSQELLYDELVI